MEDFALFLQDAWILFCDGLQFNTIYLYIKCKSIPSKRQNPLLPAAFTLLFIN